MRTRTAPSAATNLSCCKLQFAKCTCPPSSPSPGSLPFLHKKHRRWPAGRGKEHSAHSQRALQPAAACFADVASISEEVCSAPVITNVEHKVGTYTRCYRLYNTVRMHFSDIERSSFPSLIDDAVEVWKIVPIMALICACVCRPACSLSMAAWTQRCPAQMCWMC